MPIPRKTAERSKDFVSEAKEHMEKNSDQHRKQFMGDIRNISDSKGEFLLKNLDGLKMYYLKMATEATAKGNTEEAAKFVNMHASADALSKITLKKWKESLLEEQKE